LSIFIASEPIIIMADSSIIAYIREQSKAGYSEADIRAALSQQGWEESEINEAMSSAIQKTTKPPSGPVPAGKPGQKKPADPIKDKVAQLEQRSSPEPGFGIRFILPLVGGLIILINAILISIGVGDILNLISPELNVTLLNLLGIALVPFELFIINLIVGIGIVACTLLGILKPEQDLLSGVVIVSLGVMSLLSGNGFMIGSFIAIIGGALILTE
jgi:hypothetical protein